MLTAAAAPIAALVLAALAAVTWPDLARRPPGPERRSRLQLSCRVRALLPALLVGPAIAVLVPGSWWIGIPIAAAAAWWSVRRGGRPSAAQAQRHRRALAVRLDLVAACLRSGLPVATALAAVSAATTPDADTDTDTGDRAIADGRAVADGGPRSGTRPAVRVLEEVAALLAVGADAPAAWDIAAGHPDLASVAAAARRSAVGGSALAAAFCEQAAELRHRSVAEDAAAAGRAGVLMTAPLGACFLPAFLCLGLAPAVVGLLGTLHLW